MLFRQNIVKITLSIAHNHLFRPVRTQRYISYGKLAYSAWYTFVSHIYGIL